MALALASAVGFVLAVALPGPGGAASPAGSEAARSRIPSPLGDALLSGPGLSLSGVDLPEDCAAFWSDVLHADLRRLGADARVVSGRPELVLTTPRRFVTWTQELTANHSCARGNADGPLATAAPALRDFLIACRGAAERLPFEEGVSRDAETCVEEFLAMRLAATAAVVREKSGQLPFAAEVHLVYHELLHADHPSAERLANLSAQIAVGAPDAPDAARLAAILAYVRFAKNASDAIARASAQAHLKQLQALEGEGSAVAAELALGIARLGGNREQMLEELRRIERLGTFPALVAYYRAWTALELGDSSAARAAVADGLKIQPEHRGLANARFELQSATTPPPIGEVFQEQLESVGIGVRFLEASARVGEGQPFALAREVSTVLERVEP